jgi:hypothetical protein
MLGLIKEGDTRHNVHRLASRVGFVRGIQVVRKRHFVRGQASCIQTWYCADCLDKSGKTCETVRRPTAYLSRSTRVAVEGHEHKRSPKVLRISYAGSTDLLAKERAGAHEAGGSA